MREMPRQRGGLVQDWALPVPHLWPALPLQSTPLRHDCGGLHFLQYSIRRAANPDGFTTPYFSRKITFPDKFHPCPPKVSPLGMGFSGTSANPSSDSVD
jgi:hypothetical protein